MAFTINDEEVYPIGYYTPTGERKQPTVSDGEVDLTIDLSGVVNPVVTYYKDTGKTNIENVINRPVGYRSAYHSEDVIPFLNAVTLGGLNNLSPTLWLRRGYDTGKLLSGNMNWTDYTNSWINGNNGIFTDLQAAAHPIWAAIGNGAADILTLGGAGLLKSTAGQYRAGQAATLAFNNGTWDYIVGATNPNTGLKATLAESPWVPRTAFWQMPRGALISSAEKAGVPKGERYTPKWHVANYPGYLLKGLMSGSPLERQLSKNGTISVNLLNAYFNKASLIEREVANKVLAEQFAGQKIIDYNLFKKAVLNELITYDISPSQKYSSYGINRLGFDSPDTDLGIQRILVQKYPERFYLVKNDLDIIDRALGTTYFVDRLLGRGWHSNTKFPLEVRDEYMSLILNSGELYPKALVNLFSSPQIPKGNALHYDINTLGHSRTMVIPGDPKTLYILESQSDWALKSLGLTKAEKAAILNIDEQLKTRTPTGFSSLEELQAQKLTILNKASQRTQGNSYLALHLHDSYLLRQLQENLKYAAENGLTKMRYPTPETAAKIEGYPSKTLWFTPEGQELNPVTSVLYNPATGNFEAPAGTVIKRVYSPEHQTILKKYADFPKLFLKLYKGQNVKIVTDAKGNTWYEVDVPRGYLNREWLFKKGGILTINK